MHPVIKTTLPIAEALQKLLYPFAEIAIHDIKTNKIAAIYNSFSKRKVNDPSLLSAEDELLTLNDCTGPYEKINFDGKKLKSISSLIKDEKGRVVGLFCINLDISKLNDCKNIIDGFLNYQSFVSQPSQLFKDDWKEKINEFIHTYLIKQRLNLDTLNKIEKRKLIHHLNEMGAFIGKNATLYIAQILKVSRATVYNYLV